MAITRKYKTDYECSNCWKLEGWNSIDQWVITDADNYWNRWTFYGYDRNDRGAGVVELDYLPEHGKFYSPESKAERFWISENYETVADMGFILIYHDDDFWGLGIDGDGYDFNEYHWLPLYHAMGYEWHVDR